MSHAKVALIMIKNRRIIYLLKNNPHPVGGTAVIYEHVKILVDSGYDAYISLQSVPGKDLYKSSAPILAHDGKFIWKSTDIIVFPETFPDLIHAFKNAPVRKIMFCQNQYNLPFFIGSQQDFFSEYLVDGLVISSEAIREFITSLYGLTDIRYIPYSVDTKVFFSRDKKRQIAYMPRKLPRDAIFLEAVFKRTYPQYAQIPWVKIHDLDREAGASILGESEIFLSLSYQESFGLPPLEAMASGCLIAGYHGDGGREYMNEQNGWWADASDWRTCVEGLAQALKLLDEGGEELAKMHQAMADTVAKYSQEKNESSTTKILGRGNQKTYEIKLKCFRVFFTNSDGESCVVFNVSSGLLGASYGESIPVKYLSSIARALAYRPFVSRCSQTSNGASI